MLIGKRGSHRVSGNGEGSHWQTMMCMPINTPVAAGQQATMLGILTWNLTKVYKATHKSTSIDVPSKRNSMKKAATAAGDIVSTLRRAHAIRKALTQLAIRHTK